MNTVQQTATSIVVIDDHIMFREGLINLLQSIPEFCILDQAGTMYEGIEKVLSHRPDIVLMDFSLPDGTGLEATRILLESMPDCKIIFLTVYESDENLMAAIRLGAKGYMLKNVSSSALIASLRGLENGEIAMSRRMMSKVLESSRSSLPSYNHDTVSKLSPREIDILIRLQTDVSNSEIARQLFLSENTVKHHIHNILDKLGVDNRRQAGLIAREVGLKKNNWKPI